ncbi:MAG: hypothetical protein JSR99_16220 [Proteobacteria bacterium]|nr:hypothetical protein [Pseudomonadota bacterium]
MTEASTANGVLCATCSAPLQGKFCSTCGAAAAADRDDAAEGWGSLTSEFFSSRSGNGLFSVALAFLRHPVDTIIRLTDDPTYRSQWGFLTAMVGAQLTFVYVAFPRIYAALFNTPDGANNSAVLTNEIVQYVGMAILTPIQYYVCRALGSRRRTPMAYVKLCVLSVSYCTLLSLIVSAVFAGAMIADLKTVAILDLGEFWQTLNFLLAVAILVFVTASHRRFWGMRWPIAAGVTLAIAALSWLVVYPGLAVLVDRGGIAGALRSLTG